MKKGKATAASILEPWLNSDPCEGCMSCEKVCVKLQVRIDAALIDLRKESEELKKRLENTSFLETSYRLKKI